ncbi:MAG TPA: hypothetical protein VEA92_01755 [Candidatus Paceibacterota bacterium]|nr:hypothetical protein [Candidatus Paceibacterota bacterium]
MPRTLNDIIPPSRRRQMQEQAESQDHFVRTEETTTPPPFTPPPSRPTAPRPRGGRRFPYGTALIALLVVAISAGVLFAFSGAKVEITPTTNVAYVSGEFSATRATGELPFEVVTVDKTAIKSVPAETTEDANDPAQGTITIYNAQTTPQELIKNTRFQTPAGLVFRIRESVVIPAGTENAPGSVTATVYADEGGERYNIGPSDFTVPGLEGSRAFDLVYAKSTTAMTGGFSGNRPAVSETTREAQAAGLEAALATELQTAMQEAMPEGYILLPGASTVTYEPLPDTAGQGNNVDVKMRGIMTAVVFPNDALAKAIAYQVVGTYSGQPVRLTSTDNLTLTPTISGAPGAAETYGFSLAGNATITWDIDEARIAGAVAGKSRESAQVLLSGFPEVDKALLVLRPFWSQTFPQDPDKVTVEVKAAEPTE